MGSRVTVTLVYTAKPDLYVYTSTVPYGTGGFRLYLVHQQTGQRHYIASPSYGYGSSSTYVLVAGSDAVDAALVPGVYDLVYSRGHDDGSSSSWPSNSTRPTPLVPTSCTESIRSSIDGPMKTRTMPSNKLSASRHAARLRNVLIFSPLPIP